MLTTARLHIVAMACMRSKSTHHIFCIFISFAIGQLQMNQTNLLAVNMTMMLYSLLDERMHSLHNAICIAFVKKIQPKNLDS